MTRTLLRMERPVGSDGELTGDPRIRGWDRTLDHHRIPQVYARSFGSPPWGEDWDRFDEFDPEGVLVAEQDGEVVAFGICFPRAGNGYISVVAVLPEWRRRGLASAIVREAIGYLGSLGAVMIRIDAYQDAPAAVATYRSLGFEVYDTVEDEDADPRGSAEE